MTIQLIISLVIIVLLLCILLVIRNLIRRVANLESAIVNIYNSLELSYRYVRINSEHINNLWNKLTSEEVKQNKHTIN